ncbi:hypothetical protein BBB39_08245 [Bordetella trematum]|uniref:TRAP-type C4-dicarboxylate transport system, periplasmic component n=1 Tax=Bordetella trematum TaxID=123899 RepID=A0A157SMU0_9BORD|nr:TRAP transporter substrate-binding protein DctP [Bordetella trematum]AUL46958.1 hypothetical protein BTL55_08210 [Bordetella trematum]AZR93759.1 hypothetical protein BBB39_08245 [Bordetella trematum]NNH21030.1 TRAP transporter substrate-binding protein DctP [Bordetella trematum]QIM72337.1 C4-dicarboxylate ABC transporter [Bordetella trematum]SAH98902.1 TRAP-type C4-dicarboxylate transport system%2C periplasmic component [Bordetella trematum]
MKRNLSRLLAAPLLMLACAAVQAQTMKLSHQWPRGDGRDEGARAFAAEASRLDPALKFRIYPGASLISNPVKQIDALQDGTVDLAIFPLIYGVGKVPELSITILPGAVSSVDDAMQLKGSAFEQKLQELCEANGFHLLTWWWTEGGIANREREIGAPDTVKGLKMRGADRSIDTMLKSAGASVFSMPSTELYNALQTGVLDGLMTSYETFVSMRLYEQTKYATIGGDYTIFVVFQPLAISMRVWNKLTPQQQKTLEQAAASTQQAFNAEQIKVKQETLAAFGKAGARIHTMTQPEFDQWLTLAKRTAWPEYASISPAAKDLLQALEQSRKP